MRLCFHCSKPISHKLRILLFGKPEGRRPLWKLGVDRRIILEWIVKDMGYEDVDCIHMAEDRIQLQAPANTIMNVRFP
jgi:hypothetical protein